MRKEEVAEIKLKEEKSNKVCVFVLLAYTRTLTHTGTCLKTRW